MWQQYKWRIVVLLHHSHAALPTVIREHRPVLPAELGLHSRQVVRRPVVALFAALYVGLR